MRVIDHGVHAVGRNEFLEPARHLRRVAQPLDDDARRNAQRQRAADRGQRVGDVVGTDQRQLETAKVSVADAQRARRARARGHDQVARVDLARRARPARV